MASFTAPRTQADPLKRVMSNTSSASQSSSDKATRVTSNVLKKGEFGFPNGHLGYLTQQQEDSLAEFKKIVTKEGLYKPGADGKPPSDSDAVLLRFLRARRFVPTDALTQYKDTEQWRKLNELDNLYLNIDVNDFDESRRHYPQWLGRRDKRGIPLYLYRVGALDSKTMSAYTKNAADIRMATPEGGASDKKKKDKNAKDKTPPRLLRLFALYENLAGFMVQLCTALSDRPNPEVPITQSNNIVDISNVGLKQFWNLRGHMQDASVLATAHYPETLDRIFIVGAPSFFPTVWSWIKRWFDPITVSKIFILSEAQAFSTLSQFIDPENIPKQYGGKLDFQFGDFATVEPSYADRLTWKNDGASGIKDAKGELRRWPKGPVRWLEREDGDLDLEAVGSIDGKQRREVVATLKLDHPRGGWADESMPRSKTDQLSSNGAAITGIASTESAEPNSAAVAATSVPETSSETPATSNPEPAKASENPLSGTSNPALVPMQLPDSRDVAEHGIIAPVAAAVGSTLVPIAVPGAKPLNGSAAHTTAPDEAQERLSVLPPAESIGDSIAPVPLAAVAEPLPGEGAKAV